MCIDRLQSLTAYSSEDMPGSVLVYSTSTRKRAEPLFQDVQKQNVQSCMQPAASTAQHAQEEQCLLAAMKCYTALQRTN